VTILTLISEALACNSGLRLQKRTLTPFPKICPYRYGRWQRNFSKLQWPLSGSLAV